MTTPPTEPVKRGRGRPRKPDHEKKTPVKPKSGRGRGRPKGSTNKPKTDAGVTKTIAKPAGTGRPRGRPRKVDPSGATNSTATATTTTTTSQPTPKKTGTGRPRGRPRKSDPNAASTTGTAAQGSGSVMERELDAGAQDAKGDSDNGLKESDAENGKQDGS